jgi:hypothetical protein
LKGEKYMYYWETREMCGYETKLRAALRQIYLHAEEGEAVVLKFDPEVAPPTPDKD